MTGSDQLSHASHVLQSDHENALILLSLKSGRYITLDEIGRLIWLAVGSGATVTEINAKLGAQIDHFDRYAAADTEVFLAKLVSEGLLDVGAPTPVPTPHPAISIAMVPSIRLPSVPLAVVGLAFISLSLKVGGLQHLWRRVSKGTVQFVVARDADVFGQLSRIVNRASGLCPLRAECLEQSLFIAWWMRRQGVSADLKLGVTQYPLMAHAWVESNNVIVNDNRDHIAHYRLLTPVESRA